MSLFACPGCGHEVTDIKDSRPVIDRSQTAIRRRRVCRKCGDRFTTYETTRSLLRSGDLGRLRQSLQQSLKYIELMEALSE